MNLDNPFYAFRKVGQGDNDWTIVEAVNGSFPEQFLGDPNTEYEIKTKVWSDTVTVATGSTP